MRKVNVKDISEQDRKLPRGKFGRGSKIAVLPYFV